MADCHRLHASLGQRGRPLNAADKVGKNPRISRNWGIAVTVGARWPFPGSCRGTAVGRTPVSPWSWEIAGRRGTRPHLASKPNSRPGAATHVRRGSGSGRIKLTLRRMTAPLPVRASSPGPSRAVLGHSAKPAAGTAQRLSAPTMPTCSRKFSQNVRNLTGEGRCWGDTIGGGSSQDHQIELIEQIVSFLPTYGASYASSPSGSAHAAHP